MFTASFRFWTQNVALFSLTNVGQAAELKTLQYCVKNGQGKMFID